MGIVLILQMRKLRLSAVELLTHREMCGEAGLESILSGFSSLLCMLLNVYHCRP